MLQSFVRNVVTPLRDILYPAVCFTCDRPLEPGVQRICGGCWETFGPLLPTDPTWMEIREKFSAGGVVDDFLSCFLFEKEGKLQDVVHLLKYSGMKSIGVRLGREIGNRILLRPEFSSASILIPVPLHRTKERERGFNQCEYLCRGIRERAHIQFSSNLIARRKYTETQTKLNLVERKANVDDAFELSRRCGIAIRGSSFILVDDVITTGSTINACATVLKNAGAERVFAASVALAR